MVRTEFPGFIKAADAVVNRGATLALVLLTSILTYIKSAAPPLLKLVHGWRTYE